MLLLKYRNIVLAACLASAALAQASDGKPAVKGSPSPAVSNPEQGQAQQGPRVELSSLKFDFGTVWEGTEAKKNFTVKNVGDAPLTVSVRSSCGCTLVTHPKSPLNPGESDTIEISYDTGREGRAQKRVTVLTNDPRKSTQIIKVEGHVKPLFEADPRKKLFLGDADEQTVRTEVVMLKNLYDKPVPLRIEKLTGQADRFNVKLEEIKKGDLYRLTITSVPPLVEGRNAVNVVLATAPDELPSFRVHCSLSVPPRAMVSPGRIAVTPGHTETRKRSVRLKYRTSKPLQITGAYTEPNQLPLTINRPTGARGTVLSFYTIEVQVPPFADMPEDGYRLIITTDDASSQYHRMEVPIVKFDRRPRRAPRATPARGDESQ